MTLTEAIEKASGMGLVLHQICTPKHTITAYYPERYTPMEGDVIEYNEKWKRNLLFRPNKPHAREGQWRAMFAMSGNNTMMAWSKHTTGYGSTPEEAIEETLKLYNK